MEDATPPPARSTRVWRYAPRVVAAGFWTILFAGYVLYARANDLSVLDIAQRLLVVISTGFWGPFIYVG